MSDMEQRLRDAFSAKADHVTNQSLHGGLPDLTASTPVPTRRWNHSRVARTATPFLAAAAVIAVVVAAFVVGRSTQADRRPADFTTPTATVTETPPSPDPSTATATVTVTVTPTQTVPPAPTSKTQTLAEGVLGTLPSTWTPTPAPQSDSPYGTTCWGPDGSCQLAAFRADNLIMAGTPLLNQQCTSVPVQSYDMTTLDGNDAEHIVFGAACGQGAAEEWIVPTRPQVYLWHPLGTDDNLVEDAVTHAKLPGAYGPMPGVDFGFVDSVAKNQDGTYTVTFSRGILQSTKWERWTPVVTRSFTMTAGRSDFFCASWKIPSAPDAQCTVADLYAQGQKGAAPADGSRPLSSVAVFVQSDGRTVNDLESIAGLGCACPR